MIIVHPSGIETRLLSPASKSYLSRLLVGTTGINPDFISWEQLLKLVTNRYPFLLDPFSEGKTAASLSKKIKMWNQLFNTNQLKPHILENLAQYEEKHNVSKFKKKSITLLVVLIISVGIFCSLFLLMPGITNIMLASAFTLATLFFGCSASILDFHPTILIKTEQYNQKAEVSQELKIAATLTETENRITKISSKLDQKKTPGKRSGKSAVFNNRLNAPTHFFHSIHKKIPQQEPDYREINSLSITRSHLNQICVPF